MAATEAGRCQPCFKHHLGKALERRIGEDDIKESTTLVERSAALGASACPISSRSL